MPRSPFDQAISLIESYAALAISDDANADEPDDPDMGYGQSHRKQLMEAMRTRPTGPARKHAMGHTPSYHKDQKLRTPMTGRPGTRYARLKSQGLPGADASGMKAILRATCSMGHELCRMHSSNNVVYRLCPWISVYMLGL